MNALFESFGRTVVRFRWVVVAVWVIGTVLAVHAFPTLASQVNNNNSDFLPSSAPSTQAANLAKPLIGSTSQSQVQVVAATTGPRLDLADQSSLKRAVADLKQVRRSGR